MDEEQKKSEEIFILMNIGKMTVTEINTLTDKERFFLSKWFQDNWINNELKPTEGCYLCFMENCYVKMCYYTGTEWLDMWKTTLDGSIKYWMNLPKQPK